MIRFTRPCLIAVMFLCSISAQADLVDFRSSGLDPNPNNAWEMTTAVQADNFIIPFSGDYRLLSGGFWTVELSEWDGALDWYVFSDNGGEPGSILETGGALDVSRSDSGVDLFGDNVFYYSFNFDSYYNFASYTNYWLGLHMNSGFADPADLRNEDGEFVNGIFWASTPGGYGHKSHTSDGSDLSTWFENNTADFGYEDQLAFHLLFTDEFQSVPEPPPIVLIILSAMIYLSMRRRLSEIAMAA